MRAAGVNVFPAEDSYKYVNILDKVKRFYSLLNVCVIELLYHCFQLCHMVLCKG